MIKNYHPELALLRTVCFGSKANSSTDRIDKRQVETVINTQSEHLQHLLGRCALGDEAAFARLYNETAAKLNAIAFRVLRNVDTANEVLQEAFIQIWRNASEYHTQKAEPMTWMASIVRYRAFDRLKFEKRRIEGSQIKAEEEEYESLPDKQSISGVNFEVSEQLDGCLQELDDNHQRSILLAYYYGFSREEIASNFDRPINTIKSWLRRGLVRLQECIEN